MLHLRRRIDRRDFFSLVNNSDQTRQCAVSVANASGLSFHLVLRNRQYPAGGIHRGWNQQPAFSGLPASSSVCLWTGSLGDAEQPAASTLRVETEASLRFVGLTFAAATLAQWDATGASCLLPARAADRFDSDPVTTVLHWPRADKEDDMSSDQSLRTSGAVAA